LFARFNVTLEAVLLKIGVVIGIDRREKQVRLRGAVSLKESGV
jgi:hypothetical protein